MPTRRRKKRAPRAQKTAAPVDSPRSRSTHQLPDVPGLSADDAVGSSSDALAALEQSTTGAANDDAGDDAGTSPTSAASASSETANTTQPSNPAESGEPDRDRSPGKGAAASGKKHDRPKPIALEAREYKGMAQSELRNALVIEKRRNAELTRRLEVESPVAQAAMDKDMQIAIGETFGFVGDGAALVSGYPECKLPKTARERLGEVWAPIVRKYLAEHAEHFPLYVALSATGAIVFDRAVAVKDAHDERKAEAERQKKAPPAMSPAPAA